MNAELDLLLASYLDDELEPESRRQVELLLRSDPAAASKLSALTRVRDLVALLSPPESCPDVSGEVLAHVGDRRPVSWRSIAAGVSVVVSLAAAVLLLVLNRATRPILPGDRPEIVQRQHPIPSTPRSRPVPLQANTIRPIPPPISLPPLREDILKAESKSRDNRFALASLLKEGVGETRLVNVIVDDLGPASLGAVDEVVRQTSRIRPNHAKVHIVQGVTVDPEHSGKACVYVLVMDEYEYAQFRRRLNDRLPGAASDPVPAPAQSVARLSSVGQIEIFDKAEPAGTLKPPAIRDSKIAIRTPKLEQSREELVQIEGNRLVPPPREPRASTTPRKPEVHPRSDVEVALPLDAARRSVYLVCVGPRDRSKQ